MAGKLKEPKPMNTPAPGTYEPEKAEKILDSNPSYSFGLRPELKVQSFAPAPGTYDIQKSESHHTHLG
jgi:hypothetical protein